jgi:hypothetical protein
MLGDVAILAAMAIGGYWFLNNYKSLGIGGGSTTLPPVAEGELPPAGPVPTPTIDAKLGLSASETCLARVTKLNDTKDTTCKCETLGNVTFITCSYPKESLKCLKSECGNINYTSASARKTLKIDKCNCTSIPRGGLRAALESELAGSKAAAAYYQANLVRVYSVARPYKTVPRADE